MRLDEAIAEYVGHRRATGYAKNTTRIEQQALDLLLLTVGNVRCRSLDSRHGEMFAVAMTSKGLKPSTVNLYRGAFRRFCKWAATKKYLPSTANPLGTTRNLRVVNPPRRRVPARDFSRLLDAADHPQSRVIMALGLYLFLRASEIIDLDIEHLRLDEGRIRVYQRKTGKWDDMPVSKYLDAELRRWLTWYAADVATTNGPLQPHWPLVPARRRTQMWNDGSGKCGGRPFTPEFGKMNPLSRSAQIQRKAQDALRGIGWSVDPTDREGIHTLRRSGARALYDRLISTDGKARDDAIGLVQAMLHHSTRALTEHYIGLEVEVERRDALLAGADMFGEDEIRESAVPLHAVAQA
jgi:integrase